MTTVPFTPEQLNRAAWLTGNLDYLVKDHQQDVWQSLKAFVGLVDLSLAALVARSKAIVVARRQNQLVLNIARRFGKTTLGLLLFTVLCIRNDDHTYLYVAPTEGDAKDIVSDVFPVLLKDCPEDLKPKYSKGVFTFNNGSRIKIGGTWNGADGLRGRSAHGVIVDEAAHIPQHSKTSCLSYVLGSILSPQLQTTKGFIIIESTPPRNLKHDYARIIKNAEADDSLISFDIYANTSLTDEEIEDEKRRQYQLDPTGSSWKREYLVLLVPDANDLIIPEETLLQVAFSPVDTSKVQHFEHLHRYINFDHGTSDLNAVLFGFYDYENAHRVVQHELILRGGPNTDTIAREIARVKKELWGDLPVFRSICDSISKQIIIDLNAHDKIKEAGISFVNPSKVDREAMVNQLIVSMAQGQWVIDPSCKVLIDTMQTGTWQTSNTTGKREFARLGDIGHCDALAALVYFQRGLVTSRNPFSGVGHLKVGNVLVMDPEPSTGAFDVFSNALKGTRRTGLRR